MFLNVRMLLFTKISVSLVGDCLILIWKYNGLNSILNNNNKKKTQTPNFPYSLEVRCSETEEREKQNIWARIRQDFDLKMCMHVCMNAYAHVCMEKHMCLHRFSLIVPPPDIEMVSLIWTERTWLKNTALKIQITSYRLLLGC